jgi:ribonuclease-3
MARTDPTLAAELGQRIGYAFQDPALAVEAVTHRSKAVRNYERLEFLGDGVLNLVVAQMVFEQFPGLPEGELSRTRAGLVNREALLRIARQLRLGELLRLGEGELKSGGASRPSILADAVEAVLGAVFRDGGYGAAERVVRQLIQPLMEGANLAQTPKDFKTRLQEWLQARHRALPRYELLATRGEAHDQTFRIACLVEDLGVRTEAEGKSRRVAEQTAARLAFEKLQSA